MNMSAKVKGYFKTQAIPIGVLALMILIASVLSDVFFTKINMQNLLIQQASVMVVSLGMFTCILSGGIDLSVGSNLAVASVFMASFLNHSNFGTALLGTLLICMVIGLVNGFIVSALQIAPFIVTLGMMEFARGIAYWYTGSSPVSWKQANGAAVMTFIGKGKIAGIPMLTIIMIVMILGTMFIMRETIIGRITYAIGGNEEAVKLSGINTLAWKMFPYIFSGFCCAIGGVLMTARLGLGAPTNGEELANDCIAAVVIGGASFTGGKGNISGVIIGVFILGIINNLLDLLNVSSYPQMMLKGAIIVLAVIFSTIKDKNA
ncbi:MAG: ABC transporter permease [Lachnospiraceae bacterium]|jgi:ribose transport system permease protein|uniref:ABC transporter permease n=1 Tax=Candidatus Merdisoma sp. JLR.KK006 TaxID=3112626 RepID=UPI002FF0A7C1|nr:ABC transporter permease [Lachnospiraceae bacterium]MCI9305474.1 ABC transporter permease [Lachnospiraceae bacterium]